MYRRDARSITGHAALRPKCMEYGHCIYATMRRHARRKSCMVAVMSCAESLQFGVKMNSGSTHHLNSATLSAPEPNEARNESRRHVFPSSPPRALKPTSGAGSRRTAQLTLSGTRACLRGLRVGRTGDRSGRYEQESSVEKEYGTPRR